MWNGSHQHEGLAARRGGRNCDHSRDARAHEFADLLGFDVAIVVGDRQREMKTFALEAFRQAVRHH
jgi:hypothetical protein